MKEHERRLASAMALHRAGRLDEAEAGYRALLDADPRDPDPMHLLGVIADARGQYERAVALIGDALAIREQARYRSNLGMALLHAGRPEAARAACARALELRPDYPEALTNLGAALEALDRPAEAADAFRRGLALRPDSADLWCNLGNALRVLRRTEESEAAYRRAVECGPALPRAHSGLGRVLRDADRPAEAEAAFRRQVALAPGDPDAHVNLAAALGEQGRAAEAAAVLPHAVALAPARPDAHANMATALRQLGRLEEAEAACRRALDLAPDHRQALGSLGNVLRETGRLAEAEAVQRRALALLPSAVGAYNDLGITLAETGRLHEALAVLDLGAALDPADADTRHHRAFVLFLQGRLQEGWADYEARFDTRQGRADRRAFDRPRWTGEDLAGRTLLVHAEQGFGDTIQFCRFASRVAALGARVVMEVQPPLLRLLRSLDGVAELVGQGDTLPPFDRCCAMLSVPRALGIALETVPADIPYLAPPAEAVERWRERLPRTGKLRAGIVWAGNPRHINDRRRSLPFSALAPLWQVPGVIWHGLQFGPRAADAAGSPVEDLSPELHDFAETAAALLRLDVVVTPDTAIAHLAGALGVPARVMLPAAPDWRWLRGRERSPWYPSLRLYRQDEARGWETVTRAVAASLADAG